jgi:DNA-binding MarR family transcriptional regulator
MMSSTPTFTTQLLGQTEKTLNVMLDRLLAGTGLTERTWVTLTLAVAADEAVDRDEFAGRLAGAVQVSDVEARARIGELTDAGLLGSPEDRPSSIVVTDAGRQLQARIRTAVTEITTRLWGDLPDEDLATAGRVLDTVLRRAQAELAAA